MKVTKQGEWYIKVFLDKEPEDGDVPLACLCDILVNIKNNKPYTKGVSMDLVAEARTLQLIE